MTLSKRTYRPLLFLLALILLLPAPGRASEELPPEGWTGIYTRADLEAVTAQGQYILMNDIDLTGAAWTPLCSQDEPFTGILNGDGHTVYGLEVSSQDASGLFSYVFGGTVENLTVYGSAQGASAGLVAGKIGAGTLRGCTVGGTVSATLLGGGLVGQITGSGVVVAQCTAACTVTGAPAAPDEGESDSDPDAPTNTDTSVNTSTDTNPSSDTDTPTDTDTSADTSVNTDTSTDSDSDTDTDTDPEEEPGTPEILLGGIVGGVYGTEHLISFCETAGSLSFSGAYASLGGIVGEANGTLTVSDCGTEASLALSVTDSAAVGGIVGDGGSSPLSVLRCSYRADWSVGACDGELSLGGICGRIIARSGVTVDACVAYGSLTVASSACVGGIVGNHIAYGALSCVSRCSSFVSVTGSGAPLSLGGVVGANRADEGTARIENCFAGGSVTHAGEVNVNTSLFFGGIVGYNGGVACASVLRCFSSCEVTVIYPLCDGAVVGLSCCESETGEATVLQSYYRAGAREYFALPVSGADLSDPASYEGFDFETVWVMDPSWGIPLLRAANTASGVLPLGDVDGNGRLTRYDAQLVLQYLAGNANLTASQLIRADINADGVVDAHDAVRILRGC